MPNSDPPASESVPTLLSERDQALLFTHVALKTTDTIMVTDADLDHPDGPVIEHLNPASIVPRGLSARDLVGQRLNRLLRPDILAPVIAHLREARSRREPVDREASTTRRSGKPVWLSLLATPIPDQSGQFRHYLYSGRDITPRHQAEQEREATLRLLASVFGAIEVPLGVIDDAWRFGFVNPAFAKQLGWGVIELLGQPYAKVIGPTARNAVQSAFAGMVTGDQKIQLEAMLERSNGNEVPGEVTATLIIQPDGRHFRVVTVAPRLAGAAGVDSAFEAAVRKAVSRDGNPTVVAGRLQMVGLREVRALLGSRWEAVAERAYGIAERILRRHLAPSDVFSRTADDAFLVFFADLPESEAHFKALAIGLEIRERLIGEVPEIERPQVGSVVAAVPASAVRNGKGRLEDIIGDVLSQRLAQEQERVVKAAMATVKTGLTTAAIAFTPVRTVTNQPAPMLIAHPPRDLMAALSTLHELGYVDYAVEAEMALLTGCGERVLAEMGQDRNELILVGVRMLTVVQRRDADRWLPLARGLGPPAKRRLAVEVRELERDTSASRLAQLCTLLAPLFRLVAFELPTIDPGFIKSLPPPVTLVTIQAARLGGQDDESALVANAGRLVRALGAQNCRAIVKNVRSPKTMSALGRAGVTLMLPPLD